MPHLMRLKLRNNIVSKYGYIYVNVASIHSIVPHEDGSVVYYGAGEDVYAEHKPSDIVHAIDNEYTFVKNGQSLED